MTQQYSKEQQKETEQQIMRLTVALDQTTNALLAPVPVPYYVLDRMGRPRAYPSSIFDPATGKAFGSNNPLLIRIADANGVTSIADVGNLAPSTLTNMQSNFCLCVAAYQMVANNAAGNEELLRTPNIWKTSSSITSSGANAAWTPTAGKKFRLLGYNITVSKEAACAGAFVLSIQDNATTFKVLQLSNAALVATGQVEFFTENMGPNGYFSTTVNNVLNLTLSGALTAGACAISTHGTEE